MRNSLEIIIQSPKKALQCSGKQMHSIVTAFFRVRFNAVCYRQAIYVETLKYWRKEQKKCFFLLFIFLSIHDGELISNENNNKQPKKRKQTQHEKRKITYFQPKSYQCMLIGIFFLI